MSKRPSIVDSFAVKRSPAPAPVAEVVQLQQPAQQVPEIVPEAPAAVAADMMRTSIYISRRAHRRLREIALAEDVKVNDLIVEGIDAAIAKRGHSETASRKPKR